jgi:predicted anti-sigma-YlaC factor YlaD
MICREVTEFLADYLDGTLPLRQRLIFWTHLLLCRDCRRYLRSYAATLKLTRSLGEETHQQDSEIPRELFDAVMTTIRKSIN